MSAEQQWTALAAWVEQALKAHGLQVGEMAGTPMRLNWSPSQSADSRSDGPEPLIRLSLHEVSSGAAPFDPPAKGDVDAYVLIWPDGKAPPAAELSKATVELFELGFVACGVYWADVIGASLYLRSSLVSDVAQLAGPRFSVVSMSTLGTNGRFANQLFQYAYLKLYALRNSALVQVPEWEGRNLYGRAEDHPIDAVLPELRFLAFDDDDLCLWRMPSPPVNVDFWGYFQEIPSSWGPHRDLLRRWFSPPAHISWRLDEIKANLTEGGRRPLVAIHVRRGDYVEVQSDDLPWYRPIPLKWYARWLEEMRERHPDAAVFVATDMPDEILPQLAAFSPFSGEILRGLEMPPHVAEFEMLRRADHLAIANSSFSRMAAILAEEGSTCAIPDREQACFVPYKPWTDEAFWARFDDPALRPPGISGYDRESARRRSIWLRREAGNIRAAIQAAGA